MGRPDASRQFRVTEREAGTGRMSFSIPALDDEDMPPALAGEADETEALVDGEGVIDVEPVDEVETCAQSSSANASSSRLGEEGETEVTAGDASEGEMDAGSTETVQPEADAPVAQIGARNVEQDESLETAGVTLRPATPKTAAVRAREQQMEALGTMGNDQVMAAVEAIRCHPVFVDHMKRIARAERDREFCRHGMEHLLDVARIAYACALESKMPFRKEVIYAAALLHDVGKAEQYEHGKPHEEAGMKVATKILQEVDGFSALEKTAIVAAVGQHRRYSENSSPLGRLLFQADKASRVCFACSARKDCNWPKEQMNAGIKI